MEIGYYGYQAGNLTNNTSNFTDLYLDCIHEDALGPACDYLYGIPPFELRAGNVLSAIGIGILIIAALAGNGLVCVSFCHYRRLRTVPNYFIVSLAISDIIVAAFSMPLWLSFEVTGWHNLPTWVNFWVLAKFWECIDMLGAVSSIANLTAISLDRLFSIIAPLRHRTRMTPLVAIIMISIAWAYALVISLSWLTDYVHYTIIAAGFGFFIPLVIIIFSYIAIYIKYWIRSSKQGNINGDWNLEKTLLIVIGLFVSCWLPFFISTLLYQYCLSCTFDDVTARHVRGFTKWLHYLNSCCNPVVYGFCNINFKTAFWALIGSCFGSRYTDMDLGPNSRETSNSQAGTILRHLKSIKRKLSWKREVEESIVSNGGEVNDNSISLAILSLQLKNGQTEESQEAQALLEASDSRPSSKASEDLSPDEQSSFQESSGDEIMLNRSHKTNLRRSSRESSLCEFRPREFTNRTYASTHENKLKENESNLSIQDLRIGFNGSSFEKEIQSAIRVDADPKLMNDKSGLAFANRIHFQANQGERNSCEDVRSNGIEENASACGEHEALKSARDYNHLCVDLNPERRRRSGRFALDCIPANGTDLIGHDLSEIEVDGQQNFLFEDNIIDTKESIV